MPPVELLRSSNDIPIGKGLGSSAAALIAGVVIADGVLGLGWDRHSDSRRSGAHRRPSRQCRRLRAGFDRRQRHRSRRRHARRSHAVARPLRRGRRRARFHPADVQGARRSARLLFPRRRGLQHSAFRPAHRGDADPDHRGLPHRVTGSPPPALPAHLVPGLAEMLPLRAPGLLGCALSGAGPSVLVFYERGHEEVVQLFRELFAKNGHASEILWAHIPDHGYDVLHAL